MRLTCLFVSSIHFILIKSPFYSIPSFIFPSLPLPYLPVLADIWYSPDLILCINRTGGDEGSPLPCGPPALYNSFPKGTMGNVK